MPNASPPPLPPPTRRRPNRVRVGLVAALLVIYALLGLRGYGNDNDPYHMLNTWNLLRSQGVYEPSRGTGYLVPEVAIGLLSSVGGHVLSNLAASVLAAGVHWLVFGAVQQSVDCTSAGLATLAVGLHPVWMIAFRALPASHGGTPRSCG